MKQNRKQTVEMLRRICLGISGWGRMPDPKESDIALRHAIRILTGLRECRVCARPIKPSRSTAEDRHRYCSKECENHVKNYSTNAGKGSSEKKA